MKKRTAFVMISAVIMPVVGAGLIVYVNTPSKGSIKQNSSDVSIVKGESTALKEFSTSYFTVRLPDTLRLQTSTESENPSIYGQYVFSEALFASTSQIGVTLAHLNGFTLEDIPFVKQRAANPLTYERVAQDSSSIIYQTTQRDEYFIIWLHGSDYVAVAVSGRSDDFANLKNLAEQTQRSWQWR